MERDILVDALKERIRRLKGYRSVVRHENTVKTDLYEEFVWERVAKNRRVSGMAEEFNEAYGYGEAAIHDIAQVMFQHDPQIRDKREVVEGALKNLSVVKAVASSPEFTNLREMTAEDAYATATALAEMGPILHEYYQRKEQPPSQPDDGDPDPDGSDHQPSENGMPVPGGSQGASNEGGTGVDLDSAEAELDEMSDEDLEALAAALEAMEAEANSEQEARAEAEAQADLDEAGLRNKLNKAIEQAMEDLAEEEDFFRSWGIDPTDDLKQMDFETRRRYANVLKNGKLAEFRKMLGRFKVARKVAKRTRVLNRREEFYKVTLGDAINDLLPSEYALLATPETEDDFWERYADKRLLTKQYRGNEQLADGAIIALVDNSGSMNGDREKWAKAFALALLESAREAKRDFVAINFSSVGQQRVFRFTGGRDDLDAAIGFITEFYGGNTDWERPINMALDIIESDFSTEGKAKADIVLITDDECGVSQQFLERVAKVKDETGVRVYGVACAAGTSAMSKFCDDTVKVASFFDPSEVERLLAEI